MYYAASQLRDTEFFKNHREDIIKALAEPGQPRIIRDVDDAGKVEEGGDQGGNDSNGGGINNLNFYQPEAGKSFRRSDIAAMSHAEYLKHQPDIIAAQQGRNGARIIDDMPGFQTSRPVTVFESEKAYIESGGADASRKQNTEGDGTN